ncbi:uncharacterized protein DUF3185 [Paraburkholderia caballeronis]|nr:uncharacterized protein DUF3185 [Paraburkholderia caballeronis]
MDGARRVAYTAAPHQQQTGYRMIKAISLALIVGGIVLLYFGGQSFHSLANDMSRMFTGAPTNRTILLIAGGIAATIAGLIGLASSGKR